MLQASDRKAFLKLHHLTGITGFGNCMLTANTVLLVKWAGHFNGPHFYSASSGDGIAELLRNQWPNRVFKAVKPATGAGFTYGSPAAERPVQQLSSGPLCPGYIVS